MHRGWLKSIMLAGVAAMLAGCVSTEDIYRAPPPSLQPDHALQAPPPAQQALGPLQCVPYARDHSSVKLYGDAWTWWDQAAGKFPREATPESGAVMVLTNYAGPERGHVAVVRALVSPREIRVDHANWLGDGAIYVDDPVWDVSADNDWSAVKVWNARTGAWGVKIYPVEGFIGPESGASPTPAAPEVQSTPDQIALLNLIKAQ
jgi:hypothetical protein